MITFHKDTKMADVIHTNHLLLPVINRFGIYLGFHDKTVFEVCKENNIDTNFVLSILNIFHNEKYFPQETLSSFPLSLIVEYLQKTHVYYISYLLPQMEERLKKMETETAGDNLRLLVNFYNKFKQEIKGHMTDEEDNIFPYVIDLERVKEGEILKEKFLELYGETIIHKKGIREHTDTDEKLLDLKNLLIKYTPPDYNINACVAFINSLFHFEQDLKNHARIEDKILFPKVFELKTKLIDHGS